MGEEGRGGIIEWHFVIFIHTHARGRKGKGKATDRIHPSIIHLEAKKEEVEPKEKKKYNPPRRISTSGVGREEDRGGGVCVHGTASPEEKKNPHFKKGRPKKRHNLESKQQADVKKKTVDAPISFPVPKKSLHTCSS